MKPTQRDADDLASFGYRQELDRTLGSFSAFAAGFSYLSILTGVFQMFYLGFGAGGTLFIWSWPLVLAGQFLVALCFGELAAHYPLSGGAYQWAKLVGSPRLGFVVGCVYLACLGVTLAAVALALQNTLPQIWSGFQLVGDRANPRDGAVNAVALGCTLIALTTALNSFRVRVLAAVNNIGVLSELFGAIALIVLFIAYAVRSPIDVLFTAPAPGNERYWSGPFLIAASLTASYVMYGFDTASSLAEETMDPRRNAPRAIFRALGAAGLLGFLILLGALMVAPDLGAAELGRIDGGLPRIVGVTFGGTIGRLLLCAVVFAIVVCALAVQAGAVRLIFAMARDRLLPFSTALGSVSPVSKTPVTAVVIVGVTAIVILLVNVNLPRLVELITMIAVLWANLAYLIVLTALLRRRWQGRHQPTPEGSFTLGPIGLSVNVAGVAWSTFMVLNVGWPRAEVYGPLWQHRYAPLMLTAALIAIVFAAEYSMRRVGSRLVSSNEPSQ